MIPTQVQTGGHVPAVRFIREHDGDPERLLKHQLVAAFRKGIDVQRAYLAQVATGGQLGVALCLQTQHGPDRKLVQEIGAIFAAIFVKQEHLDILFISEQQEAALRSVCAPFYTVS